MIDDAVVHILAVDPGLATGLAVLQREGPDLRLVDSAELGVLDAGSYMQGWLHTFAAAPRESWEVVAERFTITAATAKNSQAPWSLKVLGILDWLLWTTTGADPGAAVVLQGPAEAKRLITNQLLRDSGIWHSGGAGHANDAIRHGAYRFARLGWRTPWT
jgi:hypothetical protein